MTTDALSLVPPRSPLRVVGIGASAGGLDAYSRLFRALPAHTGLAYLLVPHLSPTHPSELTQLVGRVASIPVAQATDGTRIEPDHLYILPPDRMLRLADGHLRLDPRPPRDGTPTVIDACFISLAEEWGPLAVGVVLSGSGSDGTAGLQAIKARGGTTYAQDFFSAAYDSMPRSAVEAGGVDFTLPPEAIAHSFAHLGASATGGHRAGEPSPTPAASVASRDEGPSLELSVADTEALETILRALQTATGVDFPHYKRPSLVRRVRRRMDQLGVADLGAYAATVREDQAELHMLFKAVLIHVTEFFRNPETFEVLQSTVIPTLLANRPNGGPIRVWVVGCASGEEVYSVAVTFLEVEAALGRKVPVRIFATDLSEDMLATARLGRYPSEISVEVSPERLTRFFVPVEGGYQIQKRLRDMCVFARQDVTRDPPYAQLDLVLCRNVLIYLDPALQHRVLRVFHYALQTGGFLALGPAETVNGSEQLFAPLDRARSLFMRRSTPSRLQLDLGWSGQQRPLLSPAPPPGLAPIPWTTAELRQAAAQALLAQHPTGSVIVNAELEVRHFQGTTSPYLDPPSGGPTVQLLRMAHPDLRLILGRLIRKAHKEAGEVRRRNISVKVGARVYRVDVAVIPVATSATEGEHFLVLFETAPSSRRDAVVEANTSTQETGPNDAGVLQLEQELIDTREYLQSVIDQQDETHAELQAAYEASLSLNEEFQSTNEELESTKEELQSVNEELHTLNDQLHQRNADLGARAAEVTALLEAMEIPLLLLTPDLRLQAFNAKAEAALRLAPNGLGQSIAQLGLPRILPELPSLVQRALTEESFLEQEVKDEYGRPYALRLWPVAQAGESPSAVVAALIDISRLKQALDHANEARAFSDAIVEAVGEPLVVFDQESHIVSTNRAFAAVFGAERERMIGQSFWEIGEGEWDRPEVRGLVDRILRTTQGVEGYEVEIEGPPDGRRIFELSGQRIIQPGSGITNVLLAIRDLTQRKRVEQQIISAGRMQAVSQLAGGVAHEINNQMTAVLGFADVLAKSPHLDEDETRSLTYILNGARRAADITRQLLAFGRRQASEPVVAGLNALVAAAEGLLVRILGPDLHLELALGQGVGNVRVDRARFEQVLVNLVLNARDAMAPGGRVIIQTAPVVVTDSTPLPPIRARVSRGSYARLVVQDTGAGMDEATLSRIFEPFFTTKPQGLGTGLGLASVYGTVKQSDGFIWAESEPGRGTTFTIDLPCVEADAPQELPSVPAVAGGGAETIVVAEDEEAVRRWLSRSLHQLGYTVREASDGAEALRLVDDTVALVLTDVVMVGMGGVELRQRLAEIRPSLPVLFMSAHAHGELLARRMVDRDAVVLQKPFDITVLVQRIRNLLETQTTS